MAANFAPGMPNITVVIIDVAFCALLAPSGPITPLMFPLPNFSFGGLSDMGMPTLPDMSMKGIKFDMPAMSIPELKIPGFVLFAPAELNAMY